MIKIALQYIPARCKETVSLHCVTVILFITMQFSMFLLGSEVMVYLDVSIVNFSLMKATQCCLKLKKSEQNVYFLLKMFTNCTSQK